MVHRYRSLSPVNFSIKERRHDRRRSFFFSLFMNRNFLFISAVAAAILGLFSCRKAEDVPSGTPAPALMSSIPENGASDVEGTSLKVVFTFDQNVKCPLEQQSRVAADNGAKIVSVVALNTDLTVSLEGLGGGKTYTVTVPQGVVKGFKSNQEDSEEIVLTFSTKEDAPAPKPDKHYTLNPVKTLSNPNATAAAKKVYNFLLEQSGKKTLSGVQSEGTANNNDHVDLIYKKTGKHPALAGYDFIFLQYSPTPAGWSWVVNYGDMSAPIAHWNAGGLVSYMWHWNVPESKAAWDAGVNNGNFDGYNFYSSKTKFDINEALKEGTWQHDFIMKDMEKVAGYLKILQDAGVPVIWRPLHEAAGNYNLYGIKNNAWFWWGRGGAEPCRQLYRLMRDTFEKEYGLNNLIWVWTLDVNQQARADWELWYPGDDYVDIVGCDIYEENTNAKGEHYQACVDLTKGNKLVTISECGNVPDPDKCYKDNEKWSWFLVWASEGYSLNTDAYWKQLMSGTHVFTREDMPSLK